MVQFMTQQMMVTPTSPQPVQQGLPMSPDVYPPTPLAMMLMLSGGPPPPPTTTTNQMPSPPASPSGVSSSSCSTAGMSPKGSLSPSSSVMATPTRHHVGHTRGGRRGRSNQQQLQYRVRLDSTSSNSRTPVRPKKSSFSSSSGSECEERFAGARFTLPPSPDAVPLPPSHWFQN
jgi:hypothetical protein